MGVKFCEQQEKETVSLTTTFWDLRYATRNIAGLVVLYRLYNHCLAQDIRSNEMSEFSESFHLRSDNQKDGEDLLKRAGLTGAVFCPVRGWVTIVPESELYEAVRPIVGVNQGLLLHYLYAEDHGWQFELYKEEKNICQYECGWDPEFAINDEKVDRVELLPLLIKADRGEDLENILHPSGLDAIITDPPAYRFARLIGLEHYEWLSGGYLDEVSQIDPKVKLVT